MKDVGDQISVFEARHIEEDPDVLLNREALFLMAILCGGDYDKVCSIVFLLHIGQLVL